MINLLVSVLDIPEIQIIHSQIPNTPAPFFFPNEEMHTLNRSPTGMSGAEVHTVGGKRLQHHLAFRRTSFPRNGTSVELSEVPLRMIHRHSSSKLFAELQLSPYTIFGKVTLFLLCCAG